MHQSQRAWIQVRHELPNPLRRRKPDQEQADRNHHRQPQWKRRAAGVSLEYMQGRGRERNDEPGDDEPGGELAIFRGCHNSSPHSVSDFVTSFVSVIRLPESRLPSWLRNLSCTFCQWGSAILNWASPFLESRSFHSLRSSPRCFAIQPSRLMMVKVLVRVVLSIPSIWPNCPWVTSPARASVCRIVNCVARIPSGLNAFSYSWLSNRDARRRLAHMQGRAGMNGFVMTIRCIYI